MRLIASFIFACCLAALSAGVPAARAQSLYEVEGTVSDKTHRPVERVVVFLENQTRARVNQTMTDGDGRFRFSRVSAGVYYLVFNPDTKLYQTAAHRLELINTSSGGSNMSRERLDIVLTPAARPPASASAGTAFAQEVPAAAEKEYAGAMESLARGREGQALAQLKRALEIFDDYFLASQQLGLFHVEKGDYAGAVAPLRRALKVNPKAVQSHVALGIALVNGGRADLAVESLDRALAIDAGSFQAHFYRGLALLNLERLDEAEKALRKAQEIGGKERAASARLYLASVYSKRGQHRKAIDELERYLRENPQAKNAASIRQAIEQLKAKL